MNDWEQRFKNSIQWATKEELTVVINECYSKANTIGRSLSFTSGSYNEKTLWKKKAAMAIEQRGKLCY